jgi:3-phenylpropionate/cinnamic acid dioxygenase small subunit
VAARDGAVTVTAAVLPGTELYGRVLEFLHREAQLLDSYRFAGWLELFTDDVDYRMPVRTTQFLAAGHGFDESEFFAENHASLETRVRRLETEFAWAEVPPSRTRHFVSNVIVEEGEREGELAVESCFLVTRTRVDRDYQLFTGLRQDVLREAETGFRIAKRLILVDQTVITATNLSVFF